MKRIIIFNILLSICIASAAQSSFKYYLMSGDVKMEEHFYEMALDYYCKARECASTNEQAELAKLREDACKKAIAREKESSVKKTTNRRLLSDQYLETGDLYSIETGEIIPSETEDEFYLYYIEVYQDYMIVARHINEDNQEEYQTTRKLPRVDENADLIRYASGEEGEDFIVIKKKISNNYGKFQNILRIENDHAFILYASPLVKELFSSEKQEENNAAPKPSEPSVLPITFSESWVLNLDGDGIRLGDSRSNDVLYAKDICWLTARFRYKCPSNYDSIIRFDVKLISPDGHLITIDGRGRKKDYSTTAVLETIPGGGILSISIGNDLPGFFKKGKYVLSIWYNDIQYTSMIVDLQ